MEFFGRAQIHGGISKEWGFDISRATRLRGVNATIGPFKVGAYWNAPPRERSVVHTQEVTMDKKPDRGSDINQQQQQTRDYVKEMVERLEEVEREQPKERRQERDQGRER